MNLVIRLFHSKVFTDCDNPTNILAFAFDARLLFIVKLTFLSPTLIIIIVTRITYYKGSF